MNLARVACKYADILIDATLASGAPATLTGVDLALVPPGDSPNQGTVWTAGSYNPATGVASILVAGPEFPSPPVGSLQVPAVGANLWARVTDVPEIDAAMVDRISLL